MKIFAWFVIALVSVFFGAGCNALTPPTPTPTAAPTATATVIPSTTPTQTATPRPSATRNPNALPPALAFALNKTQDARAMNFDFATGITNVQNGKTTEQPGLAVKGQDSTLNRHVTVSGTTSDTNEFITYEVIVSSDKVFIKGLTGVSGIDPALWYELPPEMQASVRRLPTARALLGSFDPKDFAAAKFQSAGTETVDGEICTIWEAQDAPGIQKIIGVNDAETLKKQMGVIDTSELKIWTCADGYIHQLQGQVLGHNAQNKNETANIHIIFRMNQFDTAFNILPPPDARPFALPDQATETPSAETPITAMPKATTTPAAEPSVTPTP